jgi:3-hydroxyacyl-CoA dehydrogenase/enoyl-CoA hydratase/3-hydroxybutyryl-CoA epimerase
MLHRCGDELATRAQASVQAARHSRWLTNTWPARQLLAPMLAKQVARKARKDTTRRRMR